MSKVAPPTAEVDEYAANVRMFAFLAAYFIVTAATIYTTRFSGGLALVWLGTGILAGALVYLPYSIWPRTILFFATASACATTLFGFGPGPAVPLAIVNVTEATLIAVLLCYLRPRRDFLENYHSFALMAFCASVAGPFLAGVPGAAIVALMIKGTWFWSYQQWIAGHGVGTLLGMPLALLFARGSIVRLARGADRSGFRQLALLAAGTVLVTALSLMESDYPTLYLPIIPLLAGCFLLGWIGALTALLCIALTASVELALGDGQIAQLPGGLSAQVLYLQFYLSVMMLISLPIATVLARNAMLLAKITKRDALHRLVSDHSDDAMLMVDVDGTIRYASGAAYALSEEEHLVGRQLADISAVRRPRRLRRSFLRAARNPGETEIAEHKLGHDDFEAYIETRIRAYLDSSGRLGGFVVSARDITRRRERELLHSEIEQTDPLTGLPNRRKFFKCLKDALLAADRRPFVLAVFDLDRFGDVNRRFGHDVGDLILKHVGKSMRVHSNENIFFARLSGEEFGLVAVTDPEDALATCQKVIAALDTTAALGAGRSAPAVSMSVGLVRIDHPCKIPQAMRRADDALIAAKSSMDRAVSLVA